MSNLVHVAAAAIVNSNNDVLISRRADDVHQGGLWEFPGGKLEAGESVEQALQRELEEELGIRPKTCRPLISVKHDYADRSVLLDVWKVSEYTGEATGKEGQALRWQALDALDASDFPAADMPVIRALKLPAHYMITGSFHDEAEFEQRFEQALDRGIRLVQLRLTHDWLQAGNERLAGNIIPVARRLCEQRGATLLLNVPENLIDASQPVHLHINSKKLREAGARPDCELLCVSCHGTGEIEQAIRLGADFIVLSPVQYTTSHPDAEPMGWEKFADLVSNINVPVYALGGVGPEHTELAWRAGAQGIAAISALWEGDEKLIAR